MIEKLDEVLLDLDGKEFPDGETARSIILMCLIGASVPDDAHAKPEDKVKLYLLSLKVHAKDDDWTAEETALIKARVGKICTPLAVGRVYELIDPASMK